MSDCLFIRHSGKYISQRYGHGSGHIWLSGVACTGAEKDYTQCNYAEWGQHDCSHSQDVSISCGQ